ncbi:transglycosylase domain-containing protein [Thermoflavimicrobium dichotomicum]|uniref:Penicillin-binding protein 1B n=1 Tax=Thermoflavimicrobium dichotomicum TaxID=46223 RepID=A0A1I3K8T3_9BACL|nr:PBP1A family penicillin-binding protein [Thermoflavimicrobium dichotomicum]SFI68899.1 penicillin-binding protein 1B [Thermoflavimicrobium dichotomicum]
MGDRSCSQIDSRLEQLLIWRVLKHTSRWLKTIIYASFVGGIGLGLFLVYLKSHPLPPPDIHLATKIYDDQGQLINQAEQGKPHDPIQLDSLPKHLIQATLAAEDRTFYQHAGFSLHGIARAAWINLKSGEIVQGASTITQQLARNLYLTHDRTWARKMKEAMLTVQLELHYSKNQILQLYFNHIYYGHGAYGAQQASHLYFNKPVRQLSLAESAFLAGLPRGPEYYSPYSHFDHAKKRQEHILDLMVKNQMVSKKQAEQAKQATISIIPPKKVVHPSTRANYFRDYIIRTAIMEYGLDENLVRHGGLKIYTTLNSEIQQQAEQAVTKYLQDQGDLQGALVAVDPHTGHIKAMVGGKDYRQSPFNRAFAQRQPGSSFKPIVYLSALESGYTPLTKIFSRPTSFVYQGGIYQPSNFHGQYPNRPISMREAIAQSDNIYAVSTLFQIGIDRVIDAAKKLGIKSELRPTPSLALGSYAVTPYEMAQAYSTLASGGVFHPLSGIVKIVDMDGHVLVEEKRSAKQVTTSGHAYVLTHLLSSVFEPGGTAHRVRQIFTRPAAGKTGSTDWDSWLAGYTPDLVTTVWIGYDRGKKLPTEKTRIAQYIWASFMKQATSKQPTRIFPIPPDARGVYIDQETGYLATPHCPKTRMEYFVKGTEPVISCPVHPMTHSGHSEEPSLWEKIWNWFQQ